LPLRSGGLPCLSLGAMDGFGFVLMSCAPSLIHL